MSYSFTGADIPAEAETVSVKTFQVVASTANPNVGITITESLKDLLLSQTRLDLTSSRGDLQYEGSITGYNIGSAAVADDMTTLNRLTISVNVKYVNTFDKTKNFERNFSRFADYGSSQNFSAVENELVLDITTQLTQDIIDASLGAW